MFGAMFAAITKAFAADACACRQKHGLAVQRDVRRLAKSDDAVLHASREKAPHLLGLHLLRLRAACQRAQREAAGRI